MRRFSRSRTKAMATNTPAVTPMAIINVSLFKRTRRISLLPKVCSLQNRLNRPSTSGGAVKALPYAAILSKLQRLEPRLFPASLLQFFQPNEDAETYNRDERQPSATVGR